LAGALAILLRRDSAATRHLVWLLAIVALLAVPLLSAMLPQWRVLPEWASIRPAEAEVAPSPPSFTGPVVGPAQVTQHADFVELDRTPATAQEPAAEPPASLPAPVTPQALPASELGSWSWIDALPLVWALGFGVLLLRLMAARWMLWNVTHQGTVIWSASQFAKGQPANATEDPLVTALAAVCLQLGMRQDVTLLVHPDKTIPVVWGILRCHLLLPAAARQWSGEQLRSVLLHELAHIKRRDTIAQLLTQIACALHWFNPLVWVAAWQLGVERERACDDLVLASGVRPSAYAGHLLEVVTEFSTGRWTQSCGLAMARKSSLEGRLAAVLREDQSRRSVPSALAAIALAIAVGIAVPLAMLRAADERPGEKPIPAATGTQPKDGANLQPGLEEKLKWGEPVNGLRAAFVIRHSDKPKGVGGLPDLYLVMQNVSKAPIRLTDIDVPPKVNLRVMYPKKDGRIMAGLGAREPALGDYLLGPREVAFLPMFDPDTKATNTGDPSVDGRTIGAFFAESLLKDASQTLFAEIQIDKAPEGAWTGKLITGETGGAAAAGQPQPKGNEAQSLFRVWQSGARANGKIPGGALGPLARTVEKFIRLNPTHDAAPKLAELLKRIDTSHDWTPAEAAALLDDVTAIYATLPSWVEDEPRFSLGGPIRKGQPLPAELKNAPWGEAQPDGLRVAWLLEPQAAEHRLGTSLKSRILFHNAAKSSVVFRALTWNQSGEHKARDAKGAEINITSTEWTTIPQAVACRLAPGEFIEMTAAGIGVGASNDKDEDWQNVRVGSWVEAKAGDEVIFTAAPVPLNGNFTGERAGPGWWLDFIKNRLSLDAPLPADAAERGRLLDRAVHDLFGTAPTAEEITAFVADRDPSALDSLAKRLAQREGTLSSSGSLASGPTKFRVLPADPDAAKKPRTAKGPGFYTLGGNIRLVISRRADGQRIVNEASIQFFHPTKGEPHEIKLPDGYNTWAAAWMRDATVLWVLQKKGTVRSYDFTKPAEVKETQVEPADFDKVPRPILDALLVALEVPAEPKPATPQE
jgi:hypothetical protein